MNRTQVRGVLKHLEVAKQFAEGKTIEYKDDGGRWHVTADPALAYNVEYRIKPEPRKIWRIETENGSVWSTASSKENAEIMLRRAQEDYPDKFVFRMVEYVEVMK